MPILQWPPSTEVLQRDRAAALEQWGEKTRWFENVPHSNFLPYAEAMYYKGLTFECAETFYQAMKSKDPEYRVTIAKCNPSKAKFLSRKVLLRPDWEEVKVGIMAHAQQHKINKDPKFREWLVNMAGQYIYEWNNWDDQFWAISIYTGKGENVMGRILMNLRSINFGEETPF